MYTAGAAVTLPIPPDEAWQWVGDFFGFPRWNPMVTATRVEHGGRYRRDLVSDFPDGSLEERVFRIDGARAYGYRSVNLSGGRFPILSYHGGLKVWAGGAGTHVLWINQVVPAALDGPADVLVGRMQHGRELGLSGLVVRFGGAPRALSPHRFSVALAVDLDCDAEHAWSVAGDFFAPTSLLERDGVWREQSQRRLPFVDDEALVDREVSRDDARRTYSYHSAPVERTAGLDAHVGNVVVWPTATGCRIGWSGQFMPSWPDDEPRNERLRAAFGALYAECLDGVARRLELRPRAAMVGRGGTAEPLR